ncbi:MAG: Wzz/FepE/Etk N-terminal domain-containing protein [Pseudomonadota bacterium]|nr:Wzz/FepE/Etk N-terminal domain-containing protein [Pseudomonadota bacterium]
MNKEELNNNSDEYIIDITKILSTLWTYRKNLIGLTVLGGLASIVIALNLQIIFTSSAVVIPNEQEQSSSLTSRFGGLASLAGIEPGSGQMTKDRIALAKIGSLQFFKENLYDQIIVDLAAAQAWDPDTLELIYDPDIYDEENDILLEQPSFQEAYESFSSSLIVVENKLSGLTTISVEHFSPIIAMEWATLVVSGVNNSMREEDKEEARLAIDFYQKELMNTSIKSVKDLFSELIEQEQQKFMLANVREEYVFKIIEPPVVPEKRTRPSRAKFCIIFTFISGMISVIFILIFDYFKKNRKEIF